MSASPGRHTLGLLALPGEGLLFWGLLHCAVGPGLERTPCAGRLDPRRPEGCSTCGMSMVRFLARKGALKSFGSEQPWGVFLPSAGKSSVND